MSAARLLDLTRSMRRMGGTPTGVDRVERAYLRQFLSDDIPAFGLVRTAFGYLLLDEGGLHAFQDRLDGKIAWGPTDVLSRLPRGRKASLTRVESTLRRFSVARCLPMRLRHMLQSKLPPAFDYYNVGHSNLTERVLRCVGDAGGGIHVLVHDLIPLEHPDLQRDGTVRPFKERMQRVSRMANRVICNSEDTRQRVSTQMSGWGRVPPMVVAHLGVDAPVPDPTALPEGLPPNAPYFISVGTLEPRKNHGFLLDLWDQLGPDAPKLILCGQRGWRNEELFARLDALPPGSPIIEASGLSDGAISALVQGSAGALYPSHAEGFGLPAVEARCLGARVLCNDLAVFREVLDPAVTFAPISDRKLWLETIQSWGSNPSTAGTSAGYVRPEWADHFKTVLRSI